MSKAGHKLAVCGSGGNLSELGPLVVMTLRETGIDANVSENHNTTNTVLISDAMESASLQRLYLVVHQLHDHLIPLFLAMHHR
jgi:hypothetical protein